MKGVRIKFDIREPRWSLNTSVNSMIAAPHHTARDARVGRHRIVHIHIICIMRIRINNLYYGLRTLTLR